MRGGCGGSHMISAHFDKSAKFGIVCVGNGTLASLVLSSVVLVYRSDEVTLSDLYFLFQPLYFAI